MEKENNKILEKLLKYKKEVDSIKNPQILRHPVYKSKFQNVHNQSLYINSFCNPNTPKPLQKLSKEIVNTLYDHEHQNYSNDLSNRLERYELIINFFDKNIGFLSVQNRRYLRTINNDILTILRKTDIPEMSHLQDFCLDVLSKIDSLQLNNYF